MAKLFSDFLALHGVTLSVSKSEYHFLPSRPPGLPPEPIPLRRFNRATGKLDPPKGIPPQVLQVFTALGHSLSMLGPTKACAAGAVQRISQGLRALCSKKLGMNPLIDRKSVV